MSSTYILKTTCKPSGAGQTLIFSITVIVYLYLHETIINKIYIYIYIYIYISYLTLLKAPFRGIQFLVGMQYLTIKKCIPLIPLLLGVQHMMHPLKDQRGDAEFDADAKYDVTPV